MARLYTKADLINSNRIYATRLTTQVLQEFYEEQLIPNAYIYSLNNGEMIHLIFSNDQFCHLLGFSYFGYNGISGWNQLKSKNLLITNMPNMNLHKREEIRMTNFSKIITILHNPTVYLYKNKDMNYKSDYFAVWNDGVRYYKLGIGTTANGVNYGETFQVSLMNSNDNKEIDPNNLLSVTNKFLMPRETFQNLYYPMHIAKSKVANDNELLVAKLEKLQKLEWETMINSETN